MPICKCRYCKNQLNAREAYSVLENNQKKFYCSEEHYKLDLQQKAEAAKKERKGEKPIKNRFKYFLKMLEDDAFQPAAYKEV